MTYRASAPGGGVSIGGAVTGGTANAILYVDASGNLASSSSLKFGPTAGQGITLAAGTAITDVNALSITQTWNNAAVQNGVLITITDTTSNASANALKILGGAAGATSLLTLSKAGLLTVAGGVTSSGAVTSSGSYIMSTLGRIQASGDGTFRMIDNATTGFTSLCWGPFAVGFPMWKRSGATFEAKLGDDTLYTTVSGLGFVHVSGTFANLPAATTGTISVISDASSNVVGANIVGGGSNSVVTIRGTANWRVLGNA